MSPLQRSILTVLAGRKEPMPLHALAVEVSKGRRSPIVASSIPGAFSRNRDWVTSDSGRLNAHSLVGISASGREALADHEAQREATHPMGPVIEGRFFVFVEEVHVIRRHAMIVRGAASAAEAEEIARRECEEGMCPLTASVSIERTLRARPVREGHCT